MDDLRKNYSVPIHIQKKFNSSYQVMDDNLNWFNRYHSEIGHWANKTVHKLGLDLETPHPFVYPTVSTNNSSSVSLNVLYVLICWALFFIVL